MEFADIVNSNAPLAVRVRQMVIHKTLDLPLHEAEILAETFRERVIGTEDAIEGPKAFEKRAPRSVDELRDDPAGRERRRSRRHHHAAAAGFNAFNRTMCEDI